MADPDDLIKKASGFFSKVGSTLKSTTKQVTGLGRGSVRAELDRTKVAPGETLRGKVVLALPEPIDAKRLVVTLRAHQRTVEIQHRNGSRTSVSNRSEIFHFDVELGGARSYESATTPFEIVVPPDAMDKQAPAGAHPIADAVRSVAAVLSPTVGPVEWSVSVKLEISWGRDLSHDVDIVVAR
ncbi:MAG TPA: hypothetical protein VGO00_17880 [Kofleriaceae bacterium]|nr:hypothetical protein [Kofleriaceae bacterium]